MVKQSIYQSRAHGEETPNIGRGIVNTFYISTKYQVEIIHLLRNNDKNVSPNQHRLLDDKM